MDEVPQRFPHHLFVRYEDLRDEYDTILTNIERKFSFRRKMPGEFVRIEKYKGTYNDLYKKKPVALTPEIREYIWENVDVEQETQIGYLRRTVEDYT